MKYLRVTSLLFLILLGVFVLSPYSFFIVNGDSMSPTIPDDSLQFTTSSVSAEEGDVIIFASEEGQIIHRIVSESASGFITQGDNNAITDQEAGLSPVTSEQIKAEAVTVFEGQPLYIPYVGQLIEIVKENFLLAVGSLILLIILSALYELHKKSSSDYW